MVAGKDQACGFLMYVCPYRWVLRYWWTSKNVALMLYVMREICNKYKVKLSMRAQASVTLNYDLVDRRCPETFQEASPHVPAKSVFIPHINYQVIICK